MGKSKHRKKRCRVAGRKPRPVVVSSPPEYAPRRTRPKSPEHPLVAAFEAAKIDEQQFVAGDHLRNLCETVGKSGRDSTDLERARGGSAGTPWTQAQANAAREKGRIKERLGGAKSPNWIICEAFCGYGYSMKDSVRLANIPWHPNAVISRVQEALDALCGRKRRERGQPRVARQPKPWVQRVCAGSVTKQTKRGPIILPCRSPLPAKPQHSEVGYWQNGPLLLCGKCGQAEAEFIELFGEAEVHARYRTNLWLPPPEDTPQRVNLQKAAA